MKLLFKQDIKKATDINKPQSVIAYFNGFSNGKKTKIQASSGLKVLPKHFNKSKITGIPYKSNDMNAYLEKIRSIFYDQVKEETLNDKIPSKETLKRTIRIAEGKVAEKVIITNFLDYLEDFLKQMDTMKNIKNEIGLTEATKRHYKDLKSILEKFCVIHPEGLEELALNTATYNGIDKFKAYLKNAEYATATIAKRLKSLKSVANHAKKRGIPVSSAYEEYEIGLKQTKLKEEIIYLTEEEIKQITNPDLDLPPYLKNIQRIVIIHLATGQRVSDIMKLTDKSFKAENDGSFTAIIRQQKTGKEVYIPIVNEQALEVIRTGLFRVLSDQKYNSYIKELGKRAGIDTIIKAKERKEIKNLNKKEGKKQYRLVETKGEKYKFISSHTFRRTALTQLYRAGIPEYHILQISGHTKSDTLHSYLGIDPNKEARTLELKKILQGIQKSSRN